MSPNDCRWWFGVSCLNLKQLDFHFCLQEQWWMVLGMWNYCRWNWNCICTLHIYAWGCSMPPVKAHLEFFQEDQHDETEQNWTRNSLALNPVEIYGKLSKIKLPKKKLQMPKHWERLLKESGQKISWLTTVTTWFSACPTTSK